MSLKIPDIPKFGALSISDATTTSFPALECCIANVLKTTKLWSLCSVEFCYDTESERRTTIENQGRSWEQEEAPSRMYKGVWLQMERSLCSFLLSHPNCILFMY